MPPPVMLGNLLADGKNIEKQNWFIKLFIEPISSYVLIIVGRRFDMV